MVAPALKVQIQGQTTASADNLNTYLQWCSTPAQLRAFIGLPGMAVYLEGINSIDDGKQGTFVWYATVSQVDDNLNYIIPPGASGGGWVRQGALLPIPTITGALSSVTDSNAKAVLTSIIAALVALGLATNGTS
jgi:hypothetical protein